MTGYVTHTVTYFNNVNLQTQYYFVKIWELYGRISYFALCAIPL